MQTNAVAIDPMVENMKKRNQTSTADRIRSYLRHPGSGVLALLTVGAAIVTFSVLIFLVAYILYQSIDLLQCLFAFCFPVNVVFPSVLCEHFIHHSTSFNL